MRDGQLLVRKLEGYKNFPVYVVGGVLRAIKLHERNMADMSGLCCFY